MRYLPTAMLWLWPAFVAGCGQGSPERSSNRQLPENYVQGSFVINAEATTGETALAEATQGVAASLACSAKVPQRIDWGDQGDSGVLSVGLANTFNVTFEGCDFSRDGTARIAELLGASAGVLTASPEAIATVAPVQENDPLKDDQGHLRFIRRDQACELAERNGQSVIVAVADSGVDIDHPDLQSVLWRDAQGEVIGANFVGSGASMPANRDFDDRNGHGTHVAGLIAAAANNGIGVVGVGACANVRIMPIRVLNEAGSGSSIEIERGVKWAADHGAQIINLSLGYMTKLSSRNGPAFRSALFNDMAARNVVVMAAAGNDGRTLGSDSGDGGYWYNFPSSYDHVVAVAATDNQGNLTSFSNRGDRVDIAAPGQAVLATKMGGGYVRLSGTSMATPVAAGALALALASARAGLDAGLDRIELGQAQEMLSAATLAGVSLSSDLVAAGGVVDASKLTAAARQRFPERTTTEAPTTTAPTTTPGSPEQPSAAPVAPVAAMSFAGLANGARAGWPQTIELKDVPSGTRVVYLFWGDSRQAFSRIVIDPRDPSSLRDADRWYLYGRRTLTAIAVSSQGRILATTRVQVKGH